MPRGRKPGSKNKPKVQSVSDSTVDSINNNQSTTESDERYKDIRNDVTETSISHVSGEDYCIFYSNERWGKNFIQEVLKEHGDEVKVLIREDDGTPVEITLPYKSIKYIKWPTKREMSDESKEALKQRIAKARETRLSNKNKPSENS